MSGIDQGIEKTAVLAIRTVLYGYYGFTDPRMASQPTPKRRTEHDDDTMAAYAQLFDFDIRHVKGTKMELQMDYHDVRKRKTMKLTAIRMNTLSHGFTT